MGLTFFGLTLETAPQIRQSIFKQIHEIVFHGKGGYDYITVYNMPLWLRKFTFTQIKDYYEAEQSALKNKTSPGNKSLIDADGKVNVPEFKKTSKPYQGKSSYK